MTDALRTYEGSCHCGAVRFRFRCEPITEAMRCNCSICRRLNAIMSRRYFAPEDFELLTGRDALALYHFPPAEVNHWFCKTCGIYPFHDGVDRPGHYRVNLGCVDEIDTDTLSVHLFDGRDSWTYLS